MSRPRSARRERRHDSTRHFPVSSRRPDPGIERECTIETGIHRFAHARLLSFRVCVRDLEEKRGTFTRSAETRARYYTSRQKSRLCSCKPEPKPRISFPRERELRNRVVRVKTVCCRLTPPRISRTALRINPLDRESLDRKRS